MKNEIYLFNSKTKRTNLIFKGLEEDHLTNIKFHNDLECIYAGAGIGDFLFLGDSQKGKIIRKFGQINSLTTSLEWS